MTTTLLMNASSTKSDTPAPLLHLDGLLRFAVVAEQGGFSAAARMLGLPRQALHRSVAALEAVAGVELLERSSVGVRPSEAGRRLLAHAKAILSEARAAQASLSAARARPHGRLRLTAPHLFAEQFLTEPIRDFLSAWPDVTIDVDLTVAHRDLVRDELDLAIRLGSRPTDAGYVVSLGAFANTCCVAPSYLALAGTPADPGDLADHAVIFYGRSRPHPRWRMERDGDVLNVPLRPRLRVDSAHIALSVCRSGLGIACLPTFMCAPDLSRGTLVRLWPAWQMESPGVWAFSTTRLDRNPTLRAFVDLMRARLSDVETVRSRG